MYPALVGVAGAVSWAWGVRGLQGGHCAAGTEMALNEVLVSCANSTEFGKFLILLNETNGSEVWRFHSIFGFFLEREAQGV